MPEPLLHIDGLNVRDQRELATYLKENMRSANRLKPAAAELLTQAVAANTGEVFYPGEEVSKLLADCIEGLAGWEATTPILRVSTATSLRLSVPTTLALNSRLSVSRTVISSAASTTCALVSTVPSASTRSSSSTPASSMSACSSRTPASA